MSVNFFNQSLGSEPALSTGWPKRIHEISLQRHPIVPIAGVENDPPSCPVIPTLPFRSILISGAPRGRRYAHRKSTLRRASRSARARNSSNQTAIYPPEISAEITTTTKSNDLHSDFFPRTASDRNDRNDRPSFTLLLGADARKPVTLPIVRLLPSPSRPFPYLVIRRRECQPLCDPRAHRHSRGTGRGAGGVAKRGEERESPIEYLIDYARVR